MPLITFFFDERSRLFFYYYFILNACCIGLGEPSFQFFAYLGTGLVSARRRARGPAEARAAPLLWQFRVLGASSWQSDPVLGSADSPLC